MYHKFTFIVCYFTVCTYVYLIYTTDYIRNDEDTGSSTSNVVIVTAASSISVSMVIVAAIVILILLSCWCRHRRSNGQ